MVAFLQNVNTLLYRDVSTLSLGLFMWYSFKMWKHHYIGMYPHCLDTRFLNILMYLHCHHYTGMYPHFPSIRYLSMLMYPHCRLYVGMYPHCLDSRFLGKLMYPYWLLYIQMYPHCLYIGFYPHCLGFKKSVILSGWKHWWNKGEP